MLGLSVVANVNDPDDFIPILLEDIVEAAKRTEPKLQKMIFEIVQEL